MHTINPKIYDVDTGKDTIPTTFKYIDDNFKELDDDIKNLSSNFEDWKTFSSTIVGWATPSVTFLQYTRTGKVLTIRGRITGTSNSTTTSITIPFTLANLGAGQGDFSLLFMNNGVQSTTAGCIVGADNSNVINFYRNGDFLSFTATGTKTIAFLTTLIIQ